MRTPSAIERGVFFDGESFSPEFEQILSFGLEFVHFSTNVLVTARVVALVSAKLVVLLRLS